MASKLQEMNTWRSELAAAGVEFPRSAGHAQLQKLARKHLGSSRSSRRSSSSSGCGCGCKGRKRRAASSDVQDQVANFLTTLSY